MNDEARKLHLIEAILRTEDKSVLQAIEGLLSTAPAKQPVERKFADFAGTLTDEEADEWLQNIEEGCEQIHADDWK